MVNFSIPQVNLVTIFQFSWMQTYIWGEPESWSRPTMLLVFFTGVYDTKCYLWGGRNFFSFAFLQGVTTSFYIFFYKKGVL